MLTTPMSTPRVPLGFPRLEIHNFLGCPHLSPARIAALARRDLVILSNRYIDDLAGVAAIKRINPHCKVLVYFLCRSVVFGEAHPLCNDGETAAFRDRGKWWITYEGTTLPHDLDASAREFAVAAPDPLDDTVGVSAQINNVARPADAFVAAGKLFLQGDVLVCDDELMLLAGARGNRLIVRRGYLGTAIVSHAAGSRIAAVERTGWAREEEYYGLGMSDTLNLDMSSQAPLIDGLRPNERKARLFADRYGNNPAWRACFDGVFWDDSFPSQPLRRGRRLDLYRTNRPADPRETYALLMDGIMTFYRNLRELTGDCIHVGNHLASMPRWDIHRYANGSQQESFISHWPGFKGNRIVANEVADYAAWTHESHTPTVVWNTCQPGTHDNWGMLRFALCNTLLHDGYYQYRIFTGDAYNYRYWYDEYWVDDRGEPSDDPRWRGWLGQPLGPARQLTRSIDGPQLAPASGWRLAPAFAATKAGFVGEADGALRVNLIDLGLPDSRRGETPAALRPVPTDRAFLFSECLVYDAVRLEAPLAGPLAAGAFYTLTLTIDAESPRLIRCSLLDGRDDPLDGIRFKLFARPRGESVSISFQCHTAMAEPPRLAFDLGVETGVTRLSRLSLQKGLAEIAWVRPFERGLAVVNNTDTPQPVDLAPFGRFRRIRGRQDPRHNDGGDVEGPLTVPARDGFVLQRL